MNPDLTITSPQNPRIKDVVKLRRRSHRDNASPIIIEGYREVLRAVDFGWPVSCLYYSPSHFLGENEGELLQKCRDQDIQLIECSEPVFEKIAYRDRPEGLLALGDAPLRDLPPRP